MNEFAGKNAGNAARADRHFFLANKKRLDGVAVMNVTPSSLLQGLAEKIAKIILGISCKNEGHYGNIKIFPRQINMIPL